MADGGTLVLWRETLLQKLRQHGVLGSELERRADEMMAPILAV